MKSKRGTYRRSVLFLLMTVIFVKVLPLKRHLSHFGFLITSIQATEYRTVDEQVFCYIIYNSIQIVFIFDKSGVLEMRK